MTNRELAQEYVKFARVLAKMTKGFLNHSLSPFAVSDAIERCPVNFQQFFERNGTFATLEKQKGLAQKNLLYIELVLKYGHEVAAKEIARQLRKQRLEEEREGASSLWFESVRKNKYSGDDPSPAGENSVRILEM